MTMLCERRSLRGDDLGFPTIPSILHGHHPPPSPGIPPPDWGVLLGRQQECVVPVLSPSESAQEARTGHVRKEPWSPGMLASTRGNVESSDLQPDMA